MHSRVHGIILALSLVNVYHCAPIISQHDIKHDSTWSMYPPNINVLAQSICNKALNYVARFFLYDPDTSYFSVKGLSNADSVLKTTPLNKEHIKIGASDIKFINDALYVSFDKPDTTLVFIPSKSDRLIADEQAIIIEDVAEVESLQAHEFSLVNKQQNNPEIVILSDPGPSDIVILDNEVKKKMAINYPVEIVILDDPSPSDIVVIKDKDTNSQAITKDKQDNKRISVTSQSSQVKLKHQDQSPKNIQTHSNEIKNIKTSTQVTSITSKPETVKIVESDGDSIVALGSAKIHILQDGYSEPKVQIINPNENQKLVVTRTDDETTVDLFEECIEEHGEADDLDDEFDSFVEDDDTVDVHHNHKNNI